MAWSSRLVLLRRRENNRIVSEIQPSHLIAINALHCFLTMDPLKSAQAEVVVSDLIEEVREVSIQGRASERTDNRNHLRVCEIDREVTETARDRTDQAGDFRRG